MLSALSSNVNAEETSNRVAAKSDWSVFVGDNPKECWAVSAPKEEEIQKPKKEIYKGKKILALRPFILDFSNRIFPPCDFTISEAIDKPSPTLDLESFLPLSIL